MAAFLTLCFKYWQSVHHSYFRPILPGQAIWKLFEIFPFFCKQKIEAKTKSSFELKEKKRNVKIKKGQIFVILSLLLLLLL